jgi:ferredoxin
MKVNIDRNLCQGHGLCREWAAAAISFNEEENYAFVEDENVRPEHAEIVVLARDSCPEAAIEITQQ